MPEASCLSVQGLCKWLEENVQTCASIVPWPDNACPCAASAASLVMFTVLLADRNVCVVCKIWKEKCVSGRMWGGTPFRKGGGVWLMIEWCEGKCFKKYGERVQGKMDTS